MSTDPAPMDPHGDAAEARDSLAGDFEEHVDPDLAELDDDEPSTAQDPDPDHR